MESKIGRFVVVFFVFAISSYVLYPSIKWYYFLSEEDKKLSRLSSIELLRKKTDQNKAIENLKIMIPKNKYRLKKDGEIIFNISPFFSRGEKYLFNLDKIEYLSKRIFRDQIEERKKFIDLIKKISNYNKNFTRIEELQKLRRNVVRLGLDLAGGTHLTLRVDKEHLIKKIQNNYLNEGLIDSNSISNILKNKDIDLENVSFNVETIKKNIKKDNSDLDSEDLKKLLIDKKKKMLEEYSDKVRQELKSAVDNALTVIENRIDKFGVSDTNLSKGLGDTIFIEFPMLDQKDVESTIKTITEAGQLNFKIVDEVMMGQVLNKYKIKEGSHVGSIDKRYISYNKGVPFFINEVFKELNFYGVKLSTKPDGSSLYPIEESDEFGNLKVQGFLILKNKIMLDGKNLKHASINYGKTGIPEVFFELNSKGAKNFGNATKSNIKKRMAIVLDDKIKSYPVINSEIRVNGVINLGNNPQLNEIKKLVAILKAGVLPARLSLVSEVTIGPKLGKQNIEAGLFALAIGMIIVVFFMLIYYKLAGFYAILSLFLNLFLLFSILSAFRFTLTLPGIAGIILTIGMAVDSNVIIFERMREEKRSGKRHTSIIFSGFEKAFSAILDSNLTTILVAFILSQIGSGIIKGFGFTLMWGIACSMFTALFLTKLLMETFTDLFNLKKVYV